MGHSSFGAAWDEAVEELDVDWLLQCGNLDAAALRQGPAALGAT
jgi:hypothetical protein